jgi:thiol:disulfide interchange protein DsbD
MKIFLTLLICISNIYGFSQIKVASNEKLSQSEQLCLNGKNNKSKSLKYSNFLHLPHGLKGYFDYEDGLSCSKESNKPNLVCFAAHKCINSREMEAYVWSSPEILKLLKEKFIITVLYTDERSPLHEGKQIKANDKLLTKIGEKALYYQETKFHSNTQPAYYIINSNEKMITEPFFYDLSINNFKSFLKRGLEKFKQLKNYQ